MKDFAIKKLFILLMRFVAIAVGGHSARRDFDRPRALRVLKRFVGIFIVMLIPFSGRAYMVFSTLHSFTGTNGADPRAPLVQGSDGYLYGTTSRSDNSGGPGTFFKMDPAGDFTEVLNLAAGFPALFLGSGGDLYGTEATESPNTIFKINPDGSLTTLVSFTGQAGPNPPSIWLSLGGDGNFYAVTSGGGVNYGTISRITTNGALTYLVFFSELDGSNPSGALIQDADGYFYGTTYRGGTNFVSGQVYGGFGTVFKMSTNGVLTTLHSFNGTNDGGNPIGSLVQGGDGFLYGTTSGDLQGLATIFRIGSDGVFTNLYSFTNANDGRGPRAGLVQGTDGYFYGTTSAGGTQGYGTVFRFSTNGVLTYLHSFTGGKDGSYPYASLIQGADGSFYGTTVGGGQSNQGTVFQLSELKVLPEFQSITLTNDTVVLTWNTQPGVSYQLEYASSAGSPPWFTPWREIGRPVVGTGATLSATDSTASLQRFYRVVIFP